MSFGYFERGSGLAGQELNAAISAFLEKCATIVIVYEASGVGIRLESKFLGDETEGYGRLVTKYCQ